jgi:hypothetical protein
VVSKTVIEPFFGSLTEKVQENERVSSYPKPPELFTSSFIKLTSSLKKIPSKN